VLALDDAGLDAEAWRRQPASAVGSCGDPLAALGSGQEQSLAVLEPFLDHADAVLAHLHRGALEERLPAMRSALSGFAEDKERGQFASDEAYEAHRCGRAYFEYVEAFAECGDQTTNCLFAPRMFLVGGVRIGSAEPEAFIPDDCAQRVGEDYVAEMRGISREAATTVGEMLDPAWSALADRLGALAEVHAAMDDLCTPRRRRFADADLEQARARLAEIGETFRSPEPSREAVRWVPHDDEFHVAGIGPVHQLARFDAGDASASRRVARHGRALREFVLGRGLCGASAGRLPLAAVLIDVKGASVDFLGYFYEEELFCAELPPLLDGR
jgi:hypothetical protein